MFVLGCVIYIFIFVLVSGCGYSILGRWLVYSDLHNAYIECMFWAL